jgi:hypothetical protein
MLGTRVSSGLRTLVVQFVAVTITLQGASLVQGAEQSIDLDGNAVNGQESRVVTRVLQAFPVEVENVIFNEAGGKSFSFVWPGAGPGGFDSTVPAGRGTARSRYRASRSSQPRSRSLQRA